LDYKAGKGTEKEMRVVFERDSGKTGTPWDGSSKIGRGGELDTQTSENVRLVEGDV